MRHIRKLTSFPGGHIGKWRVYVSIMKRALVLTAESCRHPFRRSLPPLRIEPLPREKWTDFTFFCASFVSGFVIFFGLVA
jgi:hypothetical protein